MRYKSVIIFVARAAFFSVSPVYAPPIVLQSDEISRFLFGLGAAAVAGAALRLAARRARGILLVLSCALSGAVIYTLAYAIPRYGPSDGWFLAGRLILWASLYTGVSALAGAMLSAFALALASPLCRSRER